MILVKNQKKAKMTFSARLNGDGTWRGLGWYENVLRPILLVGNRDNESYYDRKTAIRAAKAAAQEKGLL